MASVFKIKEGFNLLPDKKVIKADEVMLRLKAEEIIESAKAEAERIINEAKQLYEQEKERGYNEGLQQGKIHMTEQMMKMVSESVNYFASIEEKVVKIVMSALKKILGEMEPEERIVRVVRNALAAARNEKQVVVRVSPEEVESVRRRVNEIMADFPGISFLEVVPDTRLKPGGCIVESDIGIVDASIDVQLDAIYRSLSKSFKQTR